MLMTRRMCWIGLVLMELNMQMRVDGASFAYKRGGNEHTMDADEFRHAVSESIINLSIYQNHLGRFPEILWHSSRFLRFRPDRLGIAGDHWPFPAYRPVSVTDPGDAGYLFRISMDSLKDFWDDPAATLWFVAFQSGQWRTWRAEREINVNESRAADRMAIVTVRKRVTSGRGISTEFRNSAAAVRNFTRRRSHSIKHLTAHFKIFIHFLKAPANPLQFIRVYLNWFDCVQVVDTLSHSFNWFFWD